MGCGNSVQATKSVKVSPKKAKINEKDSEELLLPDNQHPCSSMFPDFERILTDISKIHRPPTTYFVACLSTNSMPLIKRTIKDFFEEDITLSLPTIGIARYEKGRIVCLGNLEYFINPNLQDSESFHFFENLLSFILGNIPKLTDILLLGLDNDDITSIQGFFKDFKCNVEQKDDLTDEDLTKYTIIFTMSNCKYGKKLHKYISEGGRLICYASLEQTDPNVQFSMNKYLSKSGIGFIPHSKEFEISKKKKSNVISSSSSLEKLSFPYIVGQYCALLNDTNPEISIIQLSILLTYFRLILPCFDRSNNPLFEDILNVSFKYLEKTNFAHEDTIFYSESQHMISVLLSDLMMRITPECIISELTEKCDKLFPGIYSPDKVETMSVEFEVKPSLFKWYSTGFWLPAGVISEVKIEPDDFENLYVQVGSQTDSLLNSSWPYKRWPNVTQLFHYENNGEPLKIASPFGGLIYLVIEEKNEKQIKIKISFTNVCKSVFLKVNNNINNDNSDDYKFDQSNFPPWGEILTKYVCFTLPLSEILKIENVSEFAKYFDNLVSILLKFIGFKRKKLFRIVFDINSPMGGSTNSYPLMLNTNCIEGIFLNEKPSSDLFTALMMIAIASFPENSLNPNIEVSFAVLSVAHTFKMNWPDISPCQFIFTNFIPLFSELWEIYEKEDSEVFAKALFSFQQIQKEKKLSPDESFVFIVNRLCALSGNDYSFLKNDASNLSISTPQKYPHYKVMYAEEEEEEGVEEI